jgi:predicted dehydrogenase
VKVAIVGCGYVADFYVATRHAHPELEWAGAWDQNADRLDGCSKRWGLHAFRSLDELCADATISLVLNLTNPRSHLEITRRCLEAGKHVYSEKPLAMTTAEAVGLAELARARGRQLSSAPCSVLSPPAQTVWHAIRAGAIGTVRLVYGNFDDGMIAPWQRPWEWRNAAGVPWPAQDEFETGCTYQHAAYVLTWLAAFFGPARKVSGFAACLLADKGINVQSMAPDFTVGCLEYGGGVVARVTCGLVAPRDKSLLIVGDDGVLAVANVRDERQRVLISRRDDKPTVAETWFAMVSSRFVRERAPLASLDRPWREYPRIGPATESLVSAEKPVDFLRGPAELSAAVAAGRPCRLSTDLGVHTVELVERLQYPDRFESKAVMTSCAPMDPLPWG